MNAWQTLVSRALVGVQETTPASAAELPTELEELLAAHLSSSTFEPLAGGGAHAQRHLVAASVVATWRRAGRKSLPSLAPPTAAPDESMRLLPRAAQSSLRRLLAGEFAIFARAWFARAAELRWRIPPELLPAALTFAGERPELRADFLRVCGERGVWLARQLPYKSFAAGEENEDWETAKGVWRFGYVVRVRAKDPAAARELVAGCWKTEAVEMREILVEALSENLSEADESWLESVLADRGAKVRANAIELLARLPNGALVQRMTARADGLLRKHKGSPLSSARLEVELPPELDDAARRDGLDAKSLPRSRELGERALRLSFILGAVPLAHWTQRLDADVATIVELAARNEHGRALLTGFSIAARRQRDAVWAAALLESDVKLDPNAAATPAQLRACLPRETAVKLLRAGIAREGVLTTPPTGWTPTGEALIEFAAPWPRALQHDVAESLQARLTVGALRPLRSGLERVFLGLDPELAELCLSPWSADETGASALFELVRFRAEALEALESAA